MNSLNANEQAVLDACIQNAMQEAGGDFGFTNQVHKLVSGMTKHQVAGYLSALQAKNLVWIDDQYGQFELNKTALGLAE